MKGSKLINKTNKHSVSKIMVVKVVIWHADSEGKF